MPNKFTNALFPALIAIAACCGGAAHATSGYSDLYSFCPKGPPCSHGALPYSGVVADSSGNLYGTTELGGIHGSCSGSSGCGTVFEITAAGKEVLRYSFCAQPSCTDGASPRAAPLRDSTGNLFGTTESGGANNEGAVYKLAADGTETAIYSFCEQTNCVDGSTPYSDLIVDGKGNLYGSTKTGGANGCGVVFKISPKGRESVVHSFGARTSDGCVLLAGVIADKSGDLFGSTLQGGAGSGGTVFEITAKGKEKILYAFCSKPGCADGAGPSALIEDKHGNLYGTTGTGGANGNGVVFKISQKGVEKIVHSFCAKKNCADGGSPYAGLIAVKRFETLYGTTVAGGSANSGVVFVIDKGKEKVLHSFSGNSGDGGAPYGPVLLMKKWLYGTTTDSAQNGFGAVFQLGTAGDGSN